MGELHLKKGEIKILKACITYCHLDKVGGENDNDAYFFRPGITVPLHPDEIIPFTSLFTSTSKMDPIVVVKSS